ncbi:hypothetical protein IMCC9480_3331 [Oxalobacteraceae bacterium IMCC9480]|nr:hypothetical protein IMCC9480_3331 [Oxalobacteraceae bacterium IMCC9480]
MFCNLARFAKIFSFRVFQCSRVGRINEISVGLRYKLF